jgi:hypothetical protein
MLVADVSRAGCDKTGERVDELPCFVQVRLMRRIVCKPTFDCRGTHQMHGGCCNYLDRGDLGDVTRCFFSRPGGKRCVAHCNPLLESFGLRGLGLGT